VQHFAHENEKKGTVYESQSVFVIRLVQITKISLMAFDSCGRKKQKGKKNRQTNDNKNSPSEFFMDSLRKKNSISYMI